MGTVSIHAPGLGELSDRRFAAVLFDLDGTLIDSTTVVDRCWRQWAQEWALPDFVVVHGVPARQVLAEVVAADRVEAAFARIEQLEVAEVDGIQILPGAREALAAVGADRSAIVTSGTRPLAGARLRYTGLPQPDVVVTPEDTPLGKPHPDPYLEAARRLGVEPADCLVVEDAPAGLAAARAAGCWRLALTSTHVAGELDADAVADSLADVLLVPDGDGFVVRPAGVRAAVGADR
jgi:mannitol-1-/sugar-/sorbitol-6-phosphatase